MPNSIRSAHVGALVVVALSQLYLMPKARAVRPFVTDDARIVDEGQLELETWTEMNRGPGQWTPTLNLMAGVTVNRWLEIIMGGGVGLDGLGANDRGRAVSVSNPVVQSKILLLYSEEDGTPGLALALGVTLPWGQGSLYDPATGMYLIAPVTSRLLRDRLLIHVNLGVVGAHEQSGKLSLRPYWGLGIDIGSALVRGIVEAYAGDPFDALGPRHATQTGMRLLLSDHINVDVTVGFQPILHAAEREIWAQVGLRLLFDLFTPGGRRGDPMGASGLWLR